MSTLAANTTGIARLSWAAGLVAAASLPHWAGLPPWMPAMLIGCIVWRFGARILRWPLPGPWLMRLLTLTAVALVLAEFRTINGLVPGSALLFVMLALKFLEARAQRDQLILFLLAYFLVFASLLDGGGPLEGLYLFAFISISTLGLLQVGRQGTLLATGPTTRIAGSLLLPAAPIMIVLFLLFPRLPGPIWSIPGASSSAASGLSDSMSPGDITNLGLSDDVAFRVEFMGLPPPASQLYWRGPVLTNFDGRSWTRPIGMRRPVEETISTAGEPSEYRVTLEPGARGLAFALEMPTAWVAQSRRHSIRMTSEYQLLIGPTDRANDRVSYSVTSYPDHRADEPLTANEREVFTRLPPDSNPRTQALVDSFLEDSPDAATIVERSLDVFRSGDFFYTLTPPPLGRHTADEFIFDTREGFCEHYASALAIMLRMAGLPTRVVTGYQGGERNPIGGYYVVRQSEAHAWTETWTPEDGWIRVDPIAAVAPERIALGLTRGGTAAPSTLAGRIGNLTLLRQAALAWDAVNNFWNDWVIGYGPVLQRSLLEWLGIERPRSRHLLWLTAGATVVMLVVLTFWLGRASRRREHRDPAARQFARFARGLARCRIEPPAPGETPTAYAARASRLLPQAADSISGIATNYLRARYEADASGEALRELRARVADFSLRYARASR
jgi:transglutaminase-like putative cysteine protease